MALQVYILTLVAFLMIDAVWLGVVAKDMYKAKLGHLMASEVNWLAAVLFYLLFAAGLLYFVIIPAIEKQSLHHALFAGAFFGLVSYATYDLTNMATLRDWPTLITVLDLAWGSFLCAAVSGISYALAVRFGL